MDDFVSFVKQTPNFDVTANYYFFRVKFRICAAKFGKNFGFSETLLFRVSYVHFLGFPSEQFDSENEFLLPKFEAGA